MSSMPHIVSLLACLTLSTAQQKLLLGRGNVLDGWAFATPGGTSSLTLSTDSVPWSGLPYFNISYDFTTGGWVAQVSPQDAAAIAVPGPLVLAFSVFSPEGNEGMNVEIMDANYKNEGNWPYLKQGWNNVTMNLTAEGGWLPAINGSMPFPLRQVSIGAGNGNQKSKVGWLGLADIYILSSASAGSVSTPLLVSLVQPTGLADGVIVSGSSNIPAQSIGVVVTNRLDTPCSADIVVQTRNATGPMGDGNWETCASVTNSIPGWTTLDLVCSVTPSSSPAGFIVMRTVYNGSSCWTVNDSQLVLEGALSIVRPQPAYTPVQRNKHSNVFGGQMEPSGISAATIGMWSVRNGPLWEWNQPNDCWNLTECFNWADYDGILRNAEAGIEVMICARELCPPWAAAKNGSGPTWGQIPGPEHYADYQRWLGVIFDRYAPHATAVEVSNEDDGMSFFMPSPLPYDYMVNLSLSLINITAVAIAQSPSAAGVRLMGLSSSMFDVKQEGNGGSTYMQYEKRILSSPGVMRLLEAVTVHPYQQHVWVPWVNPGWGNFSFQYPNETTLELACNSTVAQLMATAALMKTEAAAAGLGPDYKPILWPSEWGYNLIQTVSHSESWIYIHAALVAQGLVHMRSYPLAEYVEKAFYFAGYDGCCAESNGFFGLWRPAQRRVGPNATLPQQQPQQIPGIVPLPAVNAFSTASLLIDVPSGRLAGRFIVDHTALGAAILPGTTQLPPSCVVFDTDPASSVNAPPLIVLYILGHHYNDRTIARVVSPVLPLGLQSGLGVELPLVSSGDEPKVTLTLTLAGLPQYLILPLGANATAVCASLAWN